MAIDEIDQIELGSSPTHAERKRRRGILLLCVAGVAMGVAFNLQMSLNDNFVVNQIGITPLQKGLLEGIRESCGILALGVLAILAGLAEPIIAFAMLLLVGVGLGAYFGVHSFLWLTAMSVVWSQGLHVWMPLPGSMMLSLAEEGRTGRRLGQLQSAGALGGLGGLLVALLLTQLTVPIRPLYLLAGGGAVVAAFIYLGVPRDIKTPGPRFVVRREYGLYYFLCFLEGWRKQIFMAFAGFYLVHDYGMPLKNMLGMWIAVQAAGWFLSPLAGRLIDRAGERKVLTIYYTCLVFVFVGYAFLGNPYLLSALFVTDGVFFALAMALTTYVRRLAPPQEHTPTLSMGVAMNHVAAVSMPLVGGFLWKYLGHQWTFGIGAAAAALSLIPVSFLPGRAPAAAAGGGRARPD
jgi:hypothetical protein